MKKIAVSFAVASLLLPVISFAQTGDVPPDGYYCPNLTLNLRKGDRDATKQGQVSELQRFLNSYYDDYPDDAITGYFGNITKRFVQRFQQEQGLYPPAGYVGPKTRAAIARVCGSMATPLPPPPPPPPPPPATPPPPPPLSCVFNGQTIAHGSSVTAYQSPTVPAGQQCVSETRTCQNGSLTGTYQYASCAPSPAASCVFDNQTVPNGQSVTAYQSATVPYGQQCVSQQRTCQNGALSGSYQYASCSPATATCTPEQPQTQTLSCPAGQTGSTTQTRTSSCAQGATTPTWSPWTTTSNTCTTPPPPPPPPPPPTNVGACTYKGQSVSESHVLTNFNGWASVTCDNGAWIVNTSIGDNACDYSPTLAGFQNWRDDLGCGPRPYTHGVLAAAPRHGTSPLTVTVRWRRGYNGYMCSHTIDWGDGNSDSEPSALCYYVPENGFQYSSHMYGSPGSYTITFTGIGAFAAGVYSVTATANIRVDGPVASAQNQSPNQSQLANALSALEAALQAILKLLGQ